MHKEVLTPAQIALLPLVKKFSSHFGLAGGTAIALHIGHRESVDFNLFALKEFRNFEARKKIVSFGKIQRTVTDEKDQFTVVVRGVRLTLLHYPFPVRFPERFESVIRIPDLLTLAAMKAYALGRRAKWKDYVDLYYIATRYGSLTPIIKKAKAIFKTEFNEKNFRVQLAYFKDIDYSEKVIYMKGFAVPDAAIRKELTRLSIE